MAEELQKKWLLLLVFCLGFYEWGFSHGFPNQFMHKDIKIWFYSKADQKAITER